MPENRVVLISERTFYLTGVSKCLSAGVRLGYIAAPSGMVEEVTPCSGDHLDRAPLVVTLVTSWVKEGVINRILDWN